MDGKNKGTKPDFTNDGSKRSATRSAMIEVGSLRSWQRDAVLRKRSQSVMLYVLVSFAWTALLPFLSALSEQGRVVHHNRNSIWIERARMPGPGGSESVGCFLQLRW